MQKQKPTFLLRESFRAPDEARRAAAFRQAMEQYLTGALARPAPPAPPQAEGAAETGALPPREGEGA